MLPFTAVKGCVFCRIVAGEEPAFLIFEDEVSTAFLDRRPLFHGHVLVVPRDHCETLLNLPASSVDRFFRNVQLISRVVESAMRAEGSFVAINNRVSQSVPHLHVHVVPRSRGDGLRGFFWPRNPYRDETQMKHVQRLLNETLTDLGGGRS